MGSIASSDSSSSQRPVDPAVFASLRFTSLHFTSQPQRLGHNIRRGSRVCDAREAQTGRRIQGAWMRQRAEAKGPAMAHPMTRWRRGLRSGGLGQTKSAPGAADVR